MGSPHLILELECFQWDHLIFSGKISKFFLIKIIPY